MAVLTQSMPFGRLTDFDIQEECRCDKKICIEKLENNGFNKFLREYRLENDVTGLSSQDCKYFDIEQFNNSYGRQKHSMRLYHMNIRKFGKHRGSLKALLSTFDLNFDVIVLTEIGHDADRYINSSYLTNFDHFFVLPEGNTYGGTAVFIKKGLGSVSIRSDISEFLKRNSILMMMTHSLPSSYRSRPTIHSP